MKYGKKITKEICDYIKDGLTNKDAAVLSCITEQTLYDWIKKHSNFSQSLQKAEAEAKQKMINTVRTAASGYKDGNKKVYPVWQAAAWWLERKHRDEYALRQEITGIDGKPLIPITDIKIERSNIKGNGSAGKAAQLNGKDKIIKGGE